MSPQIPHPERKFKAVRDTSDIGIDLLMNKNKISGDGVMRSETSEEFKPSDPVQETKSITSNTRYIKFKFK